MQLFQSQKVAKLEMPNLMISKLENECRKFGSPFSSLPTIETLAPAARPDFSPFFCALVWLMSLPLNGPFHTWPKSYAKGCVIIVAMPRNLDAVFVARAVGCFANACNYTWPFATVHAIVRSLAIRNQPSCPGSFCWEKTEGNFCLSISTVQNEANGRVWHRK